MRKVLSFVLVLTLIMGSFSMAFAADTTVSSASLKDLKGTDFEMQASALVDLGVISGYTDGTFGGDKAVTRAEMAAMICKSLGLSESGANSFKDAKNHWGKAYIGMAQSMSIVTGYPDGTFKPDANVTYYEALAMIIKALGYNDDSLTGTWPNKYIVQAQKLGISDDVTISGDNAKRGDIAILIYQTLDSPIGVTNKDGEWSYDKNLAIPDNMLKRLKCYAEADGELIVRTANTALNLMPYVGAYGTVYKKNSNDKVMAIGDLDSTFLKGKFTSNGKFTADGVEYSFANSAITGAATFVNGEFDQNITSQPTSTNTTYTIAADVNGRTFDKIYSVARWSSNSATADATFSTPFNGEAFMADTYNLDQAKANKKMGNYGFTLGTDGVADPNMYILDGADSLADIKKDDVVVLYVNGSKDITKVEVSSKTVSGKITSVSEDVATGTGNNKVTIDGTTYSRHTIYDATISSDQVGKEYKLYLAFNGDYFKGERISGSDLYGIVLNLENGNSSLVNGGDSKIKLFTAEGTSKTYAVLDDAITSANKDTDKAFSGSAITGGAMVKYTLNKDGLISGLTVGSVVDSSATERAITAKGTYDGKSFADDAVIFTSETPVASTSGSGLSADNFAVAKLANLLDTDDVLAKYLTNKEDKIVAMLMDQSDAADNVYGFLTGWGENDSDSEYYISLVGADKALTYDAKYEAYSTASGFGFDKFVKLTFGALGEVKDIKVEGGMYGVTAAAVSGNAGASLRANGNTLSVVSHGGLGSTGNNAGATTLLTETSKITIDAETVVYVWNTSAQPPKFQVGARSDFGGFTKVLMYDTDDDLIVDAIAIWK